MTKAPTHKLTPMLRHYLETKEQHPDAILLYRMGDFYELFFEDAVEGAKLMDLTLTSRDKNTDNPVPMAGVPHHAIDGYIQKLVEAGKKIAICDQVEDPKLAKGMVKREVTRVITPGLNVEPGSLESDAPTYLAASISKEGRCGLAIFDLSTGEFLATETETVETILTELARIGPKEVLLATSEIGIRGEEITGILPMVQITRRPDDTFEPNRAKANIKRQFKVTSLDAYGLSRKNLAAAAAGAVLDYLIDTQKGMMEHIEGISWFEPSRYMTLDETTQTNLELTRAQWTTGGITGSLLWVLNQTMTKPGSRLMRNWVLYPLLDVAQIGRRQDAVEVFYTAGLLRSEVREILKGLSDPERLLGRFAMGRGNARDMVALKEILYRLPLLRDMIDDIDNDELRAIAVDLDPPESLAAQLQQAIVDEPPALTNQGGMFRLGYSEELDELIRLATEGKQAVLTIEREQREATGINTLKVKYNRVFGYFLEVRSSNLDKVPPNWVRKQTIANGERYITDELKRFEEKILGAEQRRKTLEEAYFQTLREAILTHTTLIKAIGSALAKLDVYSTLAEVAARNKYVRPLVDDSTKLVIIDGRHPVVEKMMSGDPFVPNDVLLDGHEQRLVIITGPNMAGKSTVMRQVALVVLMAQMGSFVPATDARIGVVDRIFTRIGAADILAKGRSTFMVEMEETSRILHQATDKSLIILDEIGRGTSTFDGVSIAWAVAEYIHDRLKTRTLFATHYHELTELELTCEGVKNFNIAVKEWADGIIFLRRMVRGGTNHSYGIHVGRMAGLPKTVVDRANEILGDLEQSALTPPGTNSAEPPAPFKARKKNRGPKPKYQPGLFDWAAMKAAEPSEVEQMLETIDPEVLSPLEALTLLVELKKKLKDS